MANNKKILSVLAHPDDESFGMGGTLAYYAAQGVDVYLICATHGEAGEVEPEFLDKYESIAKLREDELRCAAEKLGIKEVIFFDYRDSGMLGSVENDHPKALVKQKTEDVAAQIASNIKNIKPQVVLTFDPVGGYYHPDHIAIHNATVMAFNEVISNESVNEKSAYKPDKLYFHIFPKRFIRNILSILKFFGMDIKKFGKNKDIDLEMLVGEEDYPVNAVINYKGVAKFKDEASNCHASQLDFGNQSTGLMSLYRRLASKKDSFMQAYPAAPKNIKRRDLFS